MAVHSMVVLLAKDKKVKKPWPWPDNYTLKLEEFITGIININKESVVAYAGGESYTFRSGLIIKMGIKAGATSVTVTFGTAFPNAIISVSVSLENATSMGNPATITAKSTTAFTVKAIGAPINYHWIAIGH